jgi:glycerophosphoryl diester phosphodiesterase
MGKPRNSQLRDLFGKPVLNIGHRGTRGLAPENTLESFRKAYESTHIFELDTMLCGSGELVVIHDETIDRTTKGSGKVSDLSLSEIQSYDAGSFFSAEFSHAKVPTLREVLLGLPDECIFDIEVKSFGFDKDRWQLAKALLMLVTELKVQDRIFITSFDPNLLQMVKKENPDLLRGQLIDATWNERDWELSEPDLILPNFKSVTKTFVRHLEELDLIFIPYTVNQPGDWENIIQAGAYGIITDRPDLLKTFLQP